MRVLFFDVFGTLVDWRSSLIEIAESLSPGADWAPVMDDWRRAYQPALDRVRQETTWRDLDEVQSATLGDVLNVTPSRCPQPARRLWSGAIGGSAPGRTPARAWTGCAGCSSPPRCPTGTSPCSPSC